MKDSPGRELEWCLILYWELWFQLIVLSENLRTILHDLPGNFDPLPAKETIYVWVIAHFKSFNMFKERGNEKYLNIDQD